MNYLVPSRQKLAAQGRSLPGKVTGRLRQAVDAMVWQAMNRKEAAAFAGLKERSLLAALRRRHVMDHYLRECEVLRMSGRAKRLHRLEEIAASDKNQNAAVAAIKAAEGLEDAALSHGRGSVQTAGLAIVIVDAVRGTSAPAKPVIEHEPQPRREPDERVR